MSRSPGIVMLFLLMFTTVLPKQGSFEDAANTFKTLYPWFDPSEGIKQYISKNWIDQNETGD